jgi:hypothetical protein
MDAEEGDRIDIRQVFNVHEDISNPHQPVARGFCQPPGGVTFAVGVHAVSLSLLCTT